MLTPYVQDSDFTLYVGDVRDVLRQLPDGSVDCCVTSPPYWGLRDYGHDGQIGLEQTPEQYVEQMVAVFAEVRRVLAETGTCWLNLGDSYVSDPGKGGSGTPNGRNGRGEGYARERMAQVRDGKAVHGEVLRPFAVDGLRPKNLVGIPWRVAFALQDDGWYLRSDIIWSKPNPMPESVTDRPTKAHEYVFLLSKQPRYFFDQDAVREMYAPASEDRYRYAFGGDKSEALAAADKDGIGVRTRPIGMREFKGPKGPDRDKTSVLPGSGTHENHQTGERERWPNGGRNVRSVWEIATQPYPDAHFAVFPEALPERCIKAGCPERVCATCGKPAGPETVRSPLGSDSSVDPTRLTGRKGMNRERRPDEGVREITRAEQRAYAEQLRESPHRATMEAEAGPAFAHYVRTDESGARPIPAALLAEWLGRGWLTAADASDCGHGNWRTGVVLDPFMGSGTTALVARRLGRKSVGIELNEQYAELAARRLSQLSLLAEGAA